MAKKPVAARKPAKAKTKTKTKAQPPASPRKPAVKKALAANKTKQERSKTKKPPGYTPKKEAFVRAFMITRNKSEAYRRAYSTINMKQQVVWNNAYMLFQDGYVSARIAEEEQKAAAKHGVTVDRIVAEYAKIGFSDIRNVVKWGEGIAVADEDGNERIVHGVSLVPSDGLDPDVSAAIAEITQTRDGSLKIKLHDKKGALDSLGKHLNMFKEAEQPNVVVNLGEKLRRAIKRRRDKEPASD